MIRPLRWMPILALALPMLGQAAASPSIYGLVIGIDDYVWAPKLTGAVNDARDLAQTLKDLPARDVTVLLNGEATREGIFKAWDDMVAKTQPGDTIFLTYSGHGSQEREHVNGSEVDGKDENTILGGFRPTGPASFEKILDDEWQRRFSLLKGVDVVALFDNCHSGSATRGWQGPETAKLPSRFLPLGDFNPGPTPGEQLEGAKFNIQPTETFVGGSQDNQVVLELNIDGQPRGSASVYFARALRGMADANKDSKLSREELRNYVTEGVRAETEGRQTAQVDFGGEAKASLIAERIANTAIIASGPKLLKLATSNITEGVEKQLWAALSGAEKTEAAQADLTWDYAAMKVYSKNGDAVADAEAPLQVQGVVDKWKLLSKYKELSQSRPLPIRLKDGDRQYKAGESLFVEVQPRTHPYLTLINVSADGTVNYLYPISKRRHPDKPMVNPSEEYALELKATAPFGADHLLAIASPEQPVEFQKAAAALDGGMQAGALEALLKDLLKDGKHEAGLIGLYTTKAGN